MYNNYTEAELRALCRKSIESLEMWARRLIHEKFSEKYGSEYVDHKVSAENFLIKRAIRDHIHNMQSSEPGRFKRPVDTLFFDHIIYFLCNPVFYRDLFKEALSFAYPNGCNETRFFLTKVQPIRNALSHANPISIRQAEQAICYSHDFIDGLKKYYSERGLEQVWNVPRILRITDSLGNVFDNQTDSHGNSSIFLIQQELRCGDTYSITVDIDDSFPASSYDIVWKNQHREITSFKNCTAFTITFDESDVTQTHIIECTTISDKPWHKHQFFDCKIELMFPVLPPI